MADADRRNRRSRIRRNVAGAVALALGGCVHSATAPRQQNAGAPGDVTVGVTATPPAPVPPPVVPSDASGAGRDVARLAATPDLAAAAVDTAAGGSADAKRWGAPAAATDGLIWLAAQGYPKLALSVAGRAVAPGALAATLGDEDHMDTSASVEATVTNVMQGLRSFVDERGYQVLRLDAQGWGSARLPFQKLGEHPDLADAKAALAGKTLVLLHLGWYQRSVDGGTYRRLSGRWLTLVGYGEDGAGQAGTTTLIAYDPETADGAGKQAVYLRYTGLTGGRLASESLGLSASAQGFFELTGAKAPPAAGATAILDDVVVLGL